MAFMENTSDLPPQGQRSVLALAGTLSALVGLGYFAIGVMMGLDPVERLRGHGFYEQLVRTPTIALTWRPTFVIVAFLTIGLIGAVSSRVRSPDGKWEGVLRWFTIMAYVGSVTQAIDWMREYQGIKQYLRLIGQGDPVSITALEVVSAWWVDPEFLWRFGALGSWYALVGFLALRNRAMPKGCAVFGVLTGLSLVLAMVFGVSDTLIQLGSVQIAALQIPAALGGGIFGPVFHLWLASVLWKAAGEVEGSRPLGIPVSQEA